jgi:hypothetical protein
MTNHLTYTAAFDEVETVVEAMQIVYVRRLLAQMLPVWAKMPRPRPGDPLMFPLNSVATELNALHDLETLRAKYVRRVHIDPEMTKELGRLCEQAAGAIGRMANMVNVEKAKTVA